MPRSELTCREFVGLIRRLREDGFSDVDRRLFLQHRAKCPRCADYLKGYELTISATKADSGRLARFRQDDDAEVSCQQDSERQT